MDLCTLIKRWTYTHTHGHGGCDRLTDESSDDDNRKELGEHLVERGMNEYGGEEVYWCRVGSTEEMRDPAA